MVEVLASLVMAAARGISAEGALEQGSECLSILPCLLLLVKKLAILMQVRVSISPKYPQIIMIFFGGGEKL